MIQDHLEDWYSISSLLILLILSVFMCRYVNICIFDLFCQLTLSKFISAMHLSAFHQIIFNKMYEKNGSQNRID